ncbi:flagellin [Alkalibacillus silvisoli]|uniref:Flagellin n=1 Tax=Alkalibacillus silvisoli TaxID=392823 RepID=A0ABN1ABD7_9BACI
MIINNNISAMNTHRQMGINQNQMQNSMEKLSSGMRINKAGDDAAGLAISEKMRAQINGLEQASRNAQDGISMIQTAEGALDETHAILQRMRELAVQSSNDTNTNEDRAELQNEVDQLAEELTRIGDNTEFNTQELLDGSLDNKFHIGANEDQSISLSIDDMRAEALGVVGMDYGSEELGDNLEFNSLVEDEVNIEFITNEGADDELGVEVSENTVTVTLASDEDSDTSTSSYQEVMDAINNDDDASNLVQVSVLDDAGDLDADLSESNSIELAEATVNEGTGIDISSQATANSAIDTLNTAIETVSSQRSDLGAVQNRLEHTISNLDNASENLSAAESRIRDVDMASEMMEMTRANILSQASQSMLAQANQQPQSVLQLLG